MRVLVTGAAGFLGGHLVRELFRRGYLVRALLKFPTDLDWKCNAVDRAIGDLLDPEAMRDAVWGVDIVIHCAAVLPQLSNEDEVWSVNVEGTRNVLSASLDAGVKRFVYVSTDSVYGDCHHPPPGASEEAPINTSFFYEGNYPRTKFEGEKLVVAAHKGRTLDTCIIRFCLMYGPGQSAGNGIFRAWLNRRIHLLLGGGLARMSLLYVDDAVQALLLAATHPRAAGQCYNISDGAAYTKRQVVDLLYALGGRRPHLISLPAKPIQRALSIANPVLKRVKPGVGIRFDPRRVVFSTNDHLIDCGKAKREMNYRPQVLLQEGLLRTQPWLLNPNLPAW